MADYGIFPPTPTPAPAGSDRGTTGALPAPPAAANPNASLGLAANASASDIYAALTREQWDNYVTTFQPIENQLIAYATDATQPAQAAEAARTDTNNAFATQAGSEQRRLQSLGITLNPDEQAASARQQNLSQASSGIQAQNLAMDLTRQRQMGILGNPAPTASSIAQQAISVPT